MRTSQIGFIVNNPPMGFHGYYVKCQGRHDTIAVIFGRSKEKSFIQIITATDSYFTEFAPQDCHIAKRAFDIRIGENHANEQGMTLNIQSTGFTATADIKFGEFTKLRGEQKRWRKNAGESIMGPFQRLPFMECRHMIASMRHTISGQITINNKTYDFTNGTGYIEGDRGKSFPRKYFWSQAHLDGFDVSASCAIIPYFGIRFKGTICVVRTATHEYRLATYHRARVKQFDQNTLVIKQRKYKLIVEVQDTQGTLPLAAPQRGKMSRTIHESVNHTVRYVFMYKKEVIFDITSNRAAYEFSDVSIKHPQK